MLGLGLLAKLVLLIFSNYVSSDETVEVVLKQGVLSGTVNKTFWNEQDYYSFQGIPYAEPPVGDLRFQVLYLKYILFISQYLKFSFSS